MAADLELGSGLVAGVHLVHVEEDVITQLHQPLLLRPPQPSLQKHNTVSPTGLEAVSKTPLLFQRYYLKVVKK